MQVREEVVIWIGLFLVICMILGALSYVGYEKWSDLP